MLRRDGSGLPRGGKGEMLTQVERISNKIILAAGLRPELTFTSFGRHGGTTEPSTSGLTETQLMKKGQWSSTGAMAHHLHHDDEAKQHVQIIQSSGASRRPKSERLPELISRACRNGNQRSQEAIETMERVKGIEPSYSAWKAAALPLSYTRLWADQLSRQASGLNRHALLWLPERPSVPRPALPP